MKTTSDGACLPHLDAPRRPVRVWAILILVGMVTLAAFSLVVPNSGLAVSAGIATVTSICGLVHRLSSALTTSRSYTTTLAVIVTTAVVVLTIFSILVPNPYIAWVAGTSLMASIAGLIRRLVGAMATASEVADGTA